MGSAGPLAPWTVHLVRTDNPTRRVCDDQMWTPTPEGARTVAPCSLCIRIALHHPEARSYHPTANDALSRPEARDRLRALLATLPDTPPPARISDVDLALDMQGDGPTRADWLAAQRQLSLDVRQAPGA